MKTPLVVLLSLSLFCFLGGTGLAEVEIQDAFDNTSLVYQRTEGVFDYYDLSGTTAAGFTRIVRVRNELLGKNPAIQPTGPRGEQAWVFCTGSSTQFRDVHWKHQVDIRYYFDELMSSAEIAFKYLNTRACGGRVDVIFVQYADDGSVVWYQQKRLENWENWPGPYTRLPGTLQDRTWRSYSVTAEQTAALVMERPFNCIMIRELDITSEAGSGYFDDIRIRVEPYASPEPDSDNDGVIDKEDFCAATPAGVLVDSMGCRLPDPIVGGGFIVVDDTREVMVRCAGKSGGNTHHLYALVNGEEKYLFDSDQENQQVSLGVLPVGTFIQFRLDVDQSQGRFYSAGPQQNPDGRDHVQMTSTDNPFIWECGFEDTYDAQSPDYADALFFVTGVSAVTSPPGATQCPGVDTQIKATIKKLKIREYPRKHRGFLMLFMQYRNQAVDLSAGKVDVQVQLTQDGKTVALTGKKVLGKTVSKDRRRRRINRIFYHDSPR